ncbi:MAG TPA: hypothetical protein PKO06_11465, partial [Candidatus Ozemobacteraceae bacterium]|nr:hypothetical protein [Candidatus Ozemobacteraceae bacterium]
FFGQGAPFAALIGFYGSLPPERVGEVNGVGNWKFWWRHRSLATGTPAVFVDTGKFSEAVPWGRQYFGQVLASETHPIVSRGREIRQIIFTPLADYRGGLRYDMSGLVREP